MSSYTTLQPYTAMGDGRTAGPEETMRRIDVRFEEIGTPNYPSLVHAQEAALPSLAEALVQMIRSGLDNGRYLAENGVVILQLETNRE